MIVPLSLSSDNHDAIIHALEKDGVAVLRGGVYISSPLAMPSSSRLVIERDATLKFIPDFSLYKPVFSRWEGVGCWCMHPCLFINEENDVVIEGDGVIDGSGEAWWNEIRRKRREGAADPESVIEKELAALNPGYAAQPGGGGGRAYQFLRPPLVQIRKSRNVVISGVTLMSSPFWTLHPLLSDNIRIEGVTIENPADAPNTDGIDIESCSSVSVLRSSVFVGDDGIAIKSGSGKEGRAENIPSRDITIRECTVKSAHGGAVIGSETAAEISDVLVEDCVFDGTDRGVRIKTRRGRGGNIHDLIFRRLVMKDNLCPFVINTYYRCGTDDDSLFTLSSMPVDELTPMIYGITIEGCRAYDSKASAGMVVGLPEMPIKGLNVLSSSFSVSESADVPPSESDMYKGLPEPESRGFRVRNAVLHIEDTEIICDGPGLLLESGAELSDR